jgi:altronate hydrolase
MKQNIQLHLSDNVVVALATFKKGSIIHLDSTTEITLKETVSFGHKIAIKPILKGDKVLKYGLPIGIAIKDIFSGEHVHAHNLKTNYALDKKE